MTAPSASAKTARVPAISEPGPLHIPGRSRVRVTLPRLGRWAKRGLDIFASLLLLLPALPLIAIVAVLIKLADGGPVIHRRRVVGTNGEFDAYKLRSMRVDADDILLRDAALRARFEPNFKLAADPRVTGIGRIIRRFSLDELPQLLNVLRGQMSMVGPRMISPAELKKFGVAGWLFTCIKPGLTGYWQVYGDTRAPYSRRVEMELHYARHWSLGLDLKILCLTPWRVLRGAR